MLTTVIVSGLATIGVVLVQPSTQTPSSGTTDKSTSKAKDFLKTITQEIVELEIQHAMLEPVFTTEAPLMQKIESQLKSLRQRFSQIPLNDHKAVNHAVFEGIKAKIAELEVKRALLEPVFIPEAPLMQKIESQLKSLHQRIAQIQPNNQVAVKHAISEAIKAKIVELKAERSLQATQDSSTSSTLSSIDSKLKSLEKRLALR
ncbi:hypothetical protein DP117_17155 [Brasilonema sp. UFV-L1]|nr:hypothetical protein [Brasilonema sp. UFV-L1]